MIDVPVRVKDALRSGNYKKEYKIVVDLDGYHDIGTFAVNKDYQTQLLKITYGDSGLNLRPNIDYRFKNDIGGSFNSFGIFDPDRSTEPITFETAINWGDYTTVDFRFSEELEDNYEIIFYGGTANQLEIEAQEEGPFTIDNNHLISESVKFDERMCSDSELKFGLCEGTSVEFQYFDLLNIRGQHISIELDVEYKDENGNLAWHTIPMGQYDVDECSRQASTGIMKVSAYNKLKSAYLDRRANQAITDILDQYPDDTANLYVLLNRLLGDYGIIDVGEIERDLNTNPGIYYPDFERTVEARGVRLAEYVWEEQTGVWYWRIKYGHYLTVFNQILKIHMPSNWVSEGYYRFVLKTQVLLNHIRSAFYQRSDISTGKLYGYYSDLGIELTGAGYTPSDTGCSFSNFFNSGHPYIKYFQGYYELKKSDGSTLATFPLMTIFDNYETESNYQTDFYHDLFSEIYTQDGRDYNGIILYVHWPVGYSPDYLFDDSHSADSIRDFTSNLSSDEIWSIKYSVTFQMQGAAYYATEINNVNIMNVDKSDFEMMSDDVTLRDLQSAVFELNCQYGKLDRVTDLFSGIELNNGALYPRDNLYPNNGLYPMGTSESGYPSMYSKLWADEGNVRSFRYLIITYKTTETIEGQVQEVEKTLQRTVNANGTDNYNMSDNWLFRNLVWTAEQVGEYADAMVTKMQGIRWFPFEMWCAGLPFLEAGDEIEIQMKEGTYKSYVLRRTLSGIQNLQDEMINGTLDIF